MLCESLSMLCQPGCYHEKLENVIKSIKSVEDKNGSRKSNCNLDIEDFMKSKTLSYTSLSSTLEMEHNSEICL